MSEDFAELLTAVTRGLNSLQSRMENCPEVHLMEAKIAPFAESNDENYMHSSQLIKKLKRVRNALNFANAELNEVIPLEALAHYNPQSNARKAERVTIVKKIGNRPYLVDNNRPLMAQRKSTIRFLMPQKESLTEYAIEIGDKNYTTARGKIIEKIGLIEAVDDEVRAKRVRFESKRKGNEFRVPRQVNRNRVQRIPILHRPDYERGDKMRFSSPQSNRHTYFDNRAPLINRLFQRRSLNRNLTLRKFEPRNFGRKRNVSEEHSNLRTRGHTPLVRAVNSHLIVTIILILYLSVLLKGKTCAIENEKLSQQVGGSVNFQNSSTVFHTLLDSLIGENQIEEFVIGKNFDVLIIRREKRIYILKESGDPIGLLYLSQKPNFPFQKAYKSIINSADSFVSRITQKVEKITEDETPNLFERMFINIPKNLTFPFSSKIINAYDAVIHESKLLFGISIFILFGYLCLRIYLFRQIADTNILVCAKINNIVNRSRKRMRAQAMNVVRESAQMRNKENKEEAAVAIELSQRAHKNYPLRECHQRGKYNPIC